MPLTYALVIRYSSDVPGKSERKRKEEGGGGQREEGGRESAI